MLQKLHKQHSSNDLYIKPQFDSDKRFGIHHFAGVVYYKSDSFLEKNRDTFSVGLINLLGASKSQFLTKIFKIIVSTPFVHFRSIPCIFLVH